MLLPLFKICNSYYRVWTKMYLFLHKLYFIDWLGYEFIFWFTFWSLIFHGISKPQSWTTYVITQLLCWGISAPVSIWFSSGMLLLRLQLLFSQDQWHAPYECQRKKIMAFACSDYEMYSSLSWWIYARYLNTLNLTPA